MIQLPVIRWGQPYESLEIAEVIHFYTGEPIAKVSQANGGLVSRDLRKAAQARAVLRQFSCQDLLTRCRQAGRLFAEAQLPIGDGHQTPDEFIHAQSASTGLPEQMARTNMAKIRFVLENLENIVDALTRGLPLEILTRGYGVEQRGVVVSYQAQTPVLSAVLPSNSPGVHTLWLPAIPLQIGLALKPGSTEPWTPYRVMAAMVEAGIPAEAFALYPGGHEVGSALVAAAGRSMIFGSQETVDQYGANPRVQVHGPGFSKILFGDDCIDDWEAYLDLMVESVLVNGGRSCINCSSIWASRHTREIAEALADRLGPIDVLPPDDPQSALAAFPNPDMAAGTWRLIEADLKQPGVMHVTAPHGERLVLQPRCGYLRPTVVHAVSPEAAVCRKEYMFPFVSVVECPQSEMIPQIGPTLVGTCITEDPGFSAELTECTHIDRLNLGPIPTSRLNWLQPHEGNIIDFLFRSRAYQVSAERMAALIGE